MSTTQIQQPPTRKQLAYLRALAIRTGTTFTLPRTKRQASRQIASLIDRPVSNQLELALDDVAVRGGELPRGGLNGHLDSHPTDGMAGSRSTCACLAA